MKFMKKLFCTLLACLIVLGSACFVVGAAELESFSISEGISPLATNKFSMTVSANKIAKANSSFPMEVGETIQINAVYSPSSASVDFGLIDVAGNFLYLRASGGSFNKTIEIEERGNYTFAVRNNSATAIDVSGFVTY